MPRSRRFFDGKHSVTLSRLMRRAQALSLSPVFMTLRLPTIGHSQVLPRRPHELQPHPPGDTLTDSLKSCLLGLGSSVRGQPLQGPNHDLGARVPLHSVCAPFRSHLQELRARQRGQWRRAMASRGCSRCEPHRLTRESIAPRGPRLKSRCEAARPMQILGGHLRAAGGRPKKRDAFASAQCLRFQLRQLAHRDAVIQFGPSLKMRHRSSLQMGAARLNGTCRLFTMAGREEIAHGSAEGRSLDVNVTHCTYQHPQPQEQLHT